jgi:hypothetical protein
MLVQRVHANATTLTGGLRGGRTGNRLVRRDRTASSSFRFAACKPWHGLRAGWQGFDAYRRGFSGIGQARIGLWQMTLATAVARRFRIATERARGRKYRICHTMHEHDRTYAENVCEFFKAIGVMCEALEFAGPGQTPELRACFDEGTIGILGLNSQLDHCWIGDENFVDIAAKHQVPVIHWIQDHPSARWPEFTHATAANSRYLLMSGFSERYFRRYCLPDARTAWAAGDGPNWRSRIDTLSRRNFVDERPIRCLLPLNLKRVGGALGDAQARLRTLEPDIAEAVEDAIKLAQYDLSGPLDVYLAPVLARRGSRLTDQQFHFCFQIIDEIVQIRRRLRIFEVAANFPVFVQTDSIPQPLAQSSVATFSDDLHVTSMRATIMRMKTSRAVVNANYANDMLHDRTQNGLNAGCVVIVEDTPTHRRLFTHGKNALLFRYDDDSLAECLDVVCNQVDRAYEIAQAGFPIRDDPAIRFGGYHNMLDLAWR